MTSSGVGPDQEDPLKRYYRVEEIERIKWEESKKNKREPSREPPEETNPGWAAFILLLFEQIFDYLKMSVQKRLGTAGLKPAREQLLLFKAAFETMMQEDRSQDALFLKRLSNLWQNILELSLEQTNTPLYQPLKTFIKDVESYPKDETHTFGYYLDEYAGQKWLPFPYMELIHKLHHQHEMDPASSLLTRWTHMIEEILNSG